MMNEAAVDFRAVMRRVPSPVAIVTAAGDQERRGITIGSITSVSLVPPLISFSVMHVSRMHDVITRASHYAVHILAEDQVALSTSFAEPDRSGAQQFAHVSHTLDPNGVPILGGAVAILHCTAHAVHEAGDHSILIGQVRRTTDGPRSRPLVYHQGAYRRLGQHIAECVQPFQG